METMTASTLRLTNQEQKIVNYCLNKAVVAWEELAQFAKDPANVKLKTIQKSVSDIKKKYRDQNLQPPFYCKFETMIKQTEVTPATEPKIVQLRVTRGGNRVPMDNRELDARIDFKLEPYFKRVRTRTNIINLSDNEWELFNLLLNNAEKMLAMEDIKEVVYKGFGSKTPHNWADAIKRTLTKLRTNIKELKTDNRLVTVMGGNTTFYMLK